MPRTYRGRKSTPVDLSALKRPIESYEVEISFWASIPPVYTGRLFVRGQIPLNPLPQIGALRKLRAVFPHLRGLHPVPLRFFVVRADWLPGQVSSALRIRNLPDLFFSSLRISLKFAIMLDFMGLCSVFLYNS